MLLEGRFVMFFLKKDNQNTVSIIMRRDSVCMGDDCMAPHEEKIVFDKSDTIYDLLVKVAEYVPAMHDYKWQVKCGKEMIGSLISGADGKYQIEVEYSDRLITSLPEKIIFCCISE